MMNIVYLRIWDDFWLFEIILTNHYQYDQSLIVIHIIVVHQLSPSSAGCAGVAQLPVMHQSSRQMSLKGVLDEK